MEIGIPYDQTYEWRNELQQFFQVVSADSEGFVKTWDLGTYQ
jgi:hypothetical protein